MVNGKMNERDCRVEHSMRSRRIIPAGCAYLATLYPQFAALLGSAGPDQSQVAAVRGAEANISQ
jgi:hypothetical protein